MTVGVAACGASSSSSSSKSTTTTASQTATTAPAATTSQGLAGGGSSVVTGPVRGTLTGENHDPRVKRAWHYSVQVTDAAGHPLSGTVDIEFAFGGQVVGHDTPPTHAVRNGRWQDKLRFPAAAVGQPLALQAVIHTSVDSITLSWPITVRP